KSGQTLELHGLPNRDAARDKKDENPHDRRVEDALDGIIGAVAVHRQRHPLETQIAIGRDRPYSLQISPKVAGDEAIEEIGDAIGDEEPHRQEMPRQRAGEPSAYRQVGRKAEVEERRRVVNAPTAADHDEDGEGVDPMRDPHEEPMAARLPAPS